MQIGANVAPKNQLGTTTDLSMTEPPTDTAAAGLPTLPVSVVLEVACEAEISPAPQKGNVVAERFHLGLEGGRMENGGRSQGSSVTASAPRHRLGTRPRTRRPESATPAGLRLCGTRDRRGPVEGPSTSIERRQAVRRDGS